MFPIGAGGYTFMKKYVSAFLILIFLAVIMIILHRYNNKGPDSTDGSWEESAKLLFEYLYPETDYFLYATFYHNEKYSGYEFATPSDESVKGIRVIEYSHLTEHGDYHIFSMYLKLYSYDENDEREFTHSNYIGSYAVNRKTKEIVWEREEDENGMWIYNEKYKGI